MARGHRAPEARRCLRLCPPWASPSGQAGGWTAVDTDRPGVASVPRMPPPQPPLQRTACGPPAWLRFLDTPIPWEAARPPPPTPFQDPGPLPDPGREHGPDPETQGLD